ncbi:MAG TPA: TIGR03067 domain-containing protein [Ferruginibacter sp.]|nr:TIGR03067 domain-containing protein [Ferruginibacter sp.]
MKKIIAVLFIGMLISAFVTRSAINLNGKWTPIEQEIGGNALPEAAFASQQLVIEDSLYTFTAESVDKGVIRINENKMDIYGRDGVNQGKHFTAIFKLEQERLTICYNLKGDAYPEAFETQGHPAFFMCVFKKE